MAITGRHQEVVYYKVSDEYKLMSVFTEHNESFGAQTSSKKYTVNKSATRDITGYEWEMGYTGDMIKDNDVIKDMIDIARELRTGGDCVRRICIVSLDEPVTGQTGAYYAREMEVTNAVDSFEDNDGEMTVKGTLGAHSDFTQGTFNVSTKTFTASVGTE